MPQVNERQAAGPITPPNRNTRRAFGSITPRSLNRRLSDSSPFEFGGETRTYYKGTPECERFLRWRKLESTMRDVMYDFSDLFKGKENTDTLHGFSHQGDQDHRQHEFSKKFGSPRVFIWKKTWDNRFLKAFNFDFARGGSLILEEHIHCDVGCLCKLVDSRSCDRYVDTTFYCDGSVRQKIKFLPTGATKAKIGKNSKHNVCLNPCGNYFCKICEGNLITGSDGTSDNPALILFEDSGETDLWNCET